VTLGDVTGDKRLDFVVADAKVSGRVKSKYLIQGHNAGFDPVRQMRFIVMERLNVERSKLAGSRGSGATD